MEIYKKRNSEIINMKRNSKTVREISKIFDISPARVQQIIKINEDDIKNKDRIQKITSNIKSENNLNRKWPKDNILDCLRLSKVVTKTIRNYFEEQNVVEISLIDIMDLFITKNIKDRMNFLEVIPVFRLKNIGSKRIIHIINTVSSCNFGLHSKEEWNKKKTELKRYLKINKFTYLEKRID